MMKIAIAVAAAGLGVLVAGCGEPAPVPPDIQVMPCWDNVAIDCTWEQYQRIAEYNCEDRYPDDPGGCEIRTGLDDRGNPMPPHAVYLPTPEEEAKWDRAFRDSIEQSCQRIAEETPDWSCGAREVQP